MHQILITSLTNWDHLPWFKIKTRIYKIQQSIYKASKECKINKMHMLQKLMMNSSDAKIMAIQYISKNMFEYYTRHNKIKLFINTHDRFIIYQSLFRFDTCDIYMRYIVEKIKEYIAYMCIKPEWQAKLEPLYRSEISNYTDIYFVYRLNRFINYQHQNLCIYTTNQFIGYKLKSLYKYLDIVYLNNKMQSFISIRNCIIRLWKNKNLIQPLNSRVYIETLNNCHFGYLYHFLYRIILSGLQWLNMSSFILYINIFNTFKEICILISSDLTFFTYSNAIKFQSICLANINSFITCIGLNTKYSLRYKK